MATEMTRSNDAVRLQAYVKTKERAARADVPKALDLLDRAGDERPRDGDEIAG
jgi:hypothetical protein